jgi:uncharacterized protein
MKDGLIVKRSLTGLGIFATKKIPRRIRILEYTGELIDEKEANRRAGKYLFETGKGMTIDGTNRKNIARYINHSCVPNCEPIVVGTRVFIKTLRVIQPGEELAYDYGKEYFNHFIKPYGCKCPKHMRNKKPSA